MRRKPADIELWVPSAIPFFIAGVFYYLITPFLSLMFLSDQRLVAVARQYIDLSFFDFYYWLDVSIIVIFFISGFKFASLISKPSNLFNDAANFKLSPIFLWSGFSCLLLFLVWKIRANGIGFFSGYESYDKSILGPLATLVFTLALLYNFFENQFVKRTFIILFMLSSVLLLGFGSRMFFLLGIIAIGLGYLSTHKSLLKSKWLYVLVLCVFVMLISVGIWRSGYSLNNGVWGLMLSIFAVEPLFTMTSASGYLSHFDPRPLIEFPNDVAAALINFVPSIFYPNKIDLINELLYDPLKSSPFGASGLLVNLYSNFGAFYPIYIFLIGYLYGSIFRKARDSLFFRAVYFSLLPVLTFHFFREGFITILKVLFFNGLFFPAVVIGVCVFFLAKQRLKVEN